MNYILSFVFCGLVCMISEFFLDTSRLTPGHINTSLVIIGSVLSGFGLYDKLIEIFHSGATVPIMNFGHLLVTGVEEGINKFGFIGAFKGILSNAGAGISIAIVCAFITCLIFKMKN